MTFYGADEYLGIKESCRADNLLRHVVRSVQFKLGRSCADADHLANSAVKLTKLQRTIVIGGRKAEAVVHKVLLSCSVTIEHTSYLRECHMAFVNKHHKILWEEVEEGVWGLTYLSAVKIARVVFNACAVAHLSHHFNVVVDTLFNALRLDEFVVCLKKLHLLLLVSKYLGKNLFLFTTYNVVACRENIGVFKVVEDLACDCVNFTYAVNGVSKKLHSYCHFTVAGRENVHNVTTDTESGADKVKVRAFILYVDQFAEQVISVNLVAFSQGYGL